MDSIAIEAFGRRKHKLSKRQKSNKEGQDLTSNLPDHVIGHILSFLPTKEAIHTSVLSKRWMCLVTFITGLNFDDRDFKTIRKKSFIAFVDRALLHWNSGGFQSVSLALLDTYDASCIKKWISVVLNLRIKKLCVNLQNELAVSSDAFYKCRYLEELVLNRFAITVSSFVCLSSLTILKLSRTKITWDSSNESETLTLNFPALRKYETLDCSWSGVKSVTLQVPLLEVVSIKYTSNSRDSHVEIKFYAPRLTKFCYSGFVLDTILLDTDSLASADITLYNNKKSVQEIEMYVCKLLSINPESLKLCVCIKQFILAGSKDPFAAIPPFGLLSYLELNFVGCEYLLSILLKTPCLKTLVLKVIYFDGMLMNFATVPHCLLFTLKVLKFKKSVGHERGLSIAKYILENGQVLERINFCLCSQEAQEKVLSFKKSSCSVILEFSSEL
ncbi:F-box/FBD/LRR-repeat protein At3g14710-like [Vicia villosa]|uniref:F-box/FBD/LRR-repeat protein At3g14710-like n=1 Tax=Vicia villosa TaxID=3911 RepID=UPI00273C11F5|nr:F-box/FBD/LRR-repeat protein At3g14710-like [Vicia villosa]XP_058756501.1 F-box/FBD/LRR-repeat protein At3g14710-like [Vicia villosa]